MTTRTQTTATQATAEGSLKSSIQAVLVIGAFAALVAFAIDGLQTAASVTLGAGLGAANLWAIARLVAGFLSDGPKAPWVLFAAMKLTALVAVVTMLLMTGWFSLLPLAIGYGALPLGIVSGQLMGASVRKES